MHLRPPFLSICHLKKLRNDKIMYESHDIIGLYNSIMELSVSMTYIVLMILWDLEKKSLKSYLRVE